MRYRNRGIIFVVLIGCVFAGLYLYLKVNAAEETLTQTGETITAVSPAEAQQLIFQREDLVVIDVRTLRERERSAIDGSIHITMREVFGDTISWPYNKPLLLYCAVGGRSAAAAGWLQKQGYTKIYNLAGGIIEWQKQGLPIVTTK